MKLSVSFKWFDFWVGFYLDREKRTMYVCPLPMVVFKFECTLGPVTVTNVVEFDPDTVELDEPKILEIIRNRKPVKPVVFLPERSKYVLALNLLASMLSGFDDGSEPIDTWAQSDRETTIELLIKEGYIQERPGGSEEVDGSLEIRGGGYFWTERGKKLLATPFGSEEV